MEGNKFWLVSKYEKSFNHLQWVLTELKSIDGGTAEEVAQVGLAIAEKSITFSRDKVKSYLKSLRDVYGEALDELEKKSQAQSIDLSAYSRISRVCEETTSANAV